jgi:hypothetical protein
MPGAPLPGNSFQHLPQSYTASSNTTYDARFFEQVTPPPPPATARDWLELELGRVLAKA